jgi:hypothetical protein
VIVRRFAGLFAVALLALGVPVASAGAHPAPDPVCNTTQVNGIPAGAVEIDANVKLHHDLACRLWVVAPQGGSITVNLGGHTIGGILDFGDGEIIVTNGVVAESIVPLNDLVLRRVHVMGDVRPHFAFPAIEIRNSTIDGEVLLLNSSVVEHSAIGGGIGFSDDAGATLTITHNVITGGIQINSIAFPDTGGVIADNQISGSPGAGIQIADAENMIGLTIRHNTITGSAGDGISIFSTCRASCISGFRHQGPITVRGNDTVGNGGHGINVNLDPTLMPPGLVVDGGRNVASGNALDPQCVGVICKS